MAATFPVLGPKGTGGPESAGQAPRQGQTCAVRNADQHHLFPASMCPPQALFSQASPAGGIAECAWREA